MGAVVSLPSRTSRNVNRLISEADGLDAPWFAAHPERRYRVRPLTIAEQRQARCLHGMARAPDGWYVAARLAPHGVVRRFVATSGATHDLHEEACRWLFENVARIAGWDACA